MANKERTGWRDLRLSQRHRRWGWDCPAIDIDFLLIEYDSGKVVALVEYKHENAQSQPKTHPSYRALIDLGNRAVIPVFEAKYAADFSWWEITPLNKTAETILPKQVTFTEREWVILLYKIRGHRLPEGIFTEH